MTDFFGVVIVKIGWDGDADFFFLSCTSKVTSRRRSSVARTILTRRGRERERERQRERLAASKATVIKMPECAELED